MNNDELKKALADVAIALGVLDLLDTEPEALDLARNACRRALSKLATAMGRAEIAALGCAGKKAEVPVSDGVPVRLMVDCPECGHRTCIVARRIGDAVIECDVLADATDANEPCWLDWESAEIEADFEYVCSECGSKIASTMQELDDMRTTGAVSLLLEVRK